MHKRTYWKSLLLTAVLAANLLTGARIYSRENDTSAEDAYEYISLLTRVLEQVRENYVDPEQTSYHDLIYGALRGMLQSLDQHSQFMDPEMYRDMRDDTAGEFGGIGVVVSMRNAVLTVIAPMEDTPGFRAGLLPGDRIMEIDDESTEGMSLQEAVKLLRGEPGTSVDITILRPGENQVREMRLERAVIEVTSVKDARLLEEGIAYIRITQFSEPTAGDLAEALEELDQQGMKALILDLRNNPGGLLTAAIEVSQLFLPARTTIVTTRGRHDYQRHEFKSRGRIHYPDMPMTILVNNGSASASEILAGALQDHQRAIVVGEPSFGKGSVQTVIPLDDGSAIRLTTARYYTPAERLIHDQVIEPDITVPMDAEDWQRIRLHRSQREHDLDADPLEDDEDVPEDVQLERARDVLMGVMTFQARNGKPAALRRPPSR